MVNILICLYLILFSVFTHAYTFDQQTAILNQIATNTRETTNAVTNFWQVYLNDYLKISNEGTPLPSGVSYVDPLLFSILREQTTALDNSASQDTQAIIDGSLENKIIMEELIKPGGALYGISPIPHKQSSTRNSSLNIESILSKSYIPELNSKNKSLETGLPAKNFIMLLLGAGNPLKIEDNSDGNMSEKEHMAHLSLAWALNAQKAIAMGNLYNILRKKERIRGLGSLAKIQDKQGRIIADASVQEVEDFLINRRLGSASWLESMEKASPLELQRESTYILAEIQRALHAHRQQQERIMASLSAMIAQGIDLRKELGKLGKSAAQASDAGSNITMPTADLT